MAASGFGKTIIGRGPKPVNPPQPIRVITLTPDTRSAFRLQAATTVTLRLIADFDPTRNLPSFNTSQEISKDIARMSHNIAAKSAGTRTA